AMVGALDETGDIGDDEGAGAAHPDHAEVGLERGEGIVGDPGARGGDGGEEAALPGVRLADQADVGDELEHQLEPALLPLLARLPLPRGLVRCRGEAGVAPATTAAPGDQQLLARAEDLAEKLAGFRVSYFGARGHRQVEVISGSAGLGLALAVLPPLGLPLGAIAVVEQRGEVRISADVNAPAPPTVAAVGTALGDVLEAGE